MDEIPRQYQRFYNFVGADATSARVLEIGALHRPTLGRDAKNVEYADFVGTDELRRLYASHEGYNIDDFVEVTYVIKDNDYVRAVGETRFDLILASHVAEHTPNFVKWLLQLNSVLCPGGLLSLILPDKRFTFDLIRPVTHSFEILSAFQAHRRQPDVWCIYQELANHTPLIGVDLHNPPQEPIKLKRAHSDEQARSEAWSTMVSGEYRDAHCTICTPESFLSCLTDLALLGLFPFEIIRFSDTYKGEIDFFVTLQKPEAFNLGSTLASIETARSALKMLATYTVVPEGDSLIIQAI